VILPKLQLGGVLELVSKNPVPDFTVELLFIGTIWGYPPVYSCSTIGVAMAGKI
jgi:hypothetical protein